VTINTKQNTAEDAKLAAARLAELKKLLGDQEFKEYQEYQAGIEKRAKLAKAKEIATAMISENGKYALQYQKLDVQLEAIWQKALQEARVQVGLPAVEPEKVK